MTFPCTRCGACCRRVGLSPVTRDLAGPDGACRHLSPDSTCSIYETRPDVCRIDLMIERWGFDRRLAYEATAILCNTWMREDGSGTPVELTVNGTRPADGGPRLVP